MKLRALLSCFKLQRVPVKAKRSPIFGKRYLTKEDVDRKREKVMKYNFTRRLDKLG